MLFNIGEEPEKYEETQINFPSTFYARFQERKKCDSKFNVLIQQILNELLIHSREE